MFKNNWLEILLIGVLPALLTAGLLVVSGTWYLSLAISSVRSDNMTAMAVLVARVSADEERIAAIEKMDALRQIDDRDFKSEVRSTINHAVDILNDVRVEVGRVEVGPRRK